jgi:small subunit ribosomal protein S11
MIKYYYHIKSLSYSSYLNKYKQKNYKKTFYEFSQKIKGLNNTITIKRKNISNLNSGKKNYKRKGLVISKSQNNLYNIYIKCSFRSFHINVSDSTGKVLKLLSSGQLGFEKAQRHNQISLQTLSNEIISFFSKKNKKSLKVNILLKGFSPKRNKLIRFFIRSKIKKSIISIIDLSDLPYNGCRPKKLRRK